MELMTLAEETKQNSWKTDLYFWLQALVVVLTALILIFTFVGRIIVVDGASMEPTLYHGDLLLLQSVGYTPKQGDVVVLTKEFEDADGPIVKRVIATGGQHVAIDYDAGTVTVDGQVLDEPYIKEAMVRPPEESITDILVPEGSIFVMGPTSRRPWCGPRRSPSRIFWCPRAPSSSWGTTATTPPTAAMSRWARWMSGMYWGRPCG